MMSGSCVSAPIPKKMRFDTKKHPANQFDCYFRTCFLKKGIHR